MSSPSLHPTHQKGTNQMPAKQPIRTSTATITLPNGATVQATAATRLEALAQAVELLATAASK